MNIFIFDLDIVKNVQSYPDVYTYKMIVETAQILCYVHHKSGTQQDWMYKNSKSHSNHPCTLWAYENLCNYNYLCFLGLEICKEYTYRYGKKHKSQEIIEKCLKTTPNIKTGEGITLFSMAMPEIYRDKTDVAKSYRDYFNNEKQHLAKWSKRPTPDWFINK